MQLITPRLILREVEESDWPVVLAYQRDPRYLRYDDWAYRTERDVRGFLREFVDGRDAYPRVSYHFAIVRKEDRRLIGLCSLRRAAATSFAAELGYEITPDEWGRGYAGEAAAALLEFGFAQLELHRVRAACIADNLASARVMEKIGMRPEGRAREEKWFKGRWWDTLHYAILVYEWQELRRAAPAGEVDIYHDAPLLDDTVRAQHAAPLRDGPLAHPGPPVPAQHAVPVRDATPARNGAPTCGRRA